MNPPFAIKVFFVRAWFERPSDPYQDQDFPLFWCLLNCDFWYRQQLKWQPSSQHTNHAKFSVRPQPQQAEHRAAHRRPDIRSWRASKTIFASSSKKSSALAEDLESRVTTSTPIVARWTVAGQCQASLSRSFARIQLGQGYLSRGKFNTAPPSMSSKYMDIYGEEWIQRCWATE